MADFLKDAPLLKRDGDSYKQVNAAEHLKGKVVALYFSAHWCPPCKAFTPVLKDFYDDLEEKHSALEIIFVSFDRTEDDLKKYMKESHGNWCVVKFGSETIQSLSQKYGISGIPALVVIKPNGDAVTSNGRSEVQAKPPPQVFDAWKAQCGV